MKYLFISFLLTFSYSNLAAQDLNVSSPKPSIDTSVYKKWPNLQGGIISNDGRYVCYTIDNQPVGSRTLVLQSTQDKWKIEIAGATGARFTPDGRKAVFIKPNDSLCIVSLGSPSGICIPSVISFKLFENNKAEWLAYQIQAPDKKVVVWNLKTGKKQTYSSVSSYWPVEKKHSLVLQTVTKHDSTTYHSLKWINLASGSVTTFWEGAIVTNLIFDKHQEQLAFTSIQPVNNTIETKIWHYKAGTHRAISLTSFVHAGLSDDLKIDNIFGYNDNGNSILLTVKKETPVFPPRTDAVPVNIWSYTDTKLQSQQLSEINNAATANRYVAALPIQKQRIIPLEQEHDFLFANRGNFAFIYHRSADVDPSEKHWNVAAKAEIHVVSFKDGMRRQLKKLDNLEVAGDNISPDGKYVVYYDERQNSFFSYEVESGVIRIITPGIATSWVTLYGNELHRSPRGIAGWLQGNKAVLIYDRNDIWKADLTGVKPPLNLTNGYGRRHKLIFYLTLQDNTSSTIPENAPLILNAFDLNNKDNGFYRKNLYKTGDPELLTMGPYLYEIPYNPYIPQGAGSPPLKARNAAVYLVKRMNATTSPNYFVTTDFKNFIPLSNLHPEYQYNWYRTELHTWKTLDGGTSQGILYKPENFDSNKKYPVIFYYYERMSDGLNAYLKPQILPNGCTIDIPTYVSNGYLVFTPDIRYTVGDPMQGTYNAVVSAASYICQFPFVNEKKLGLQGCSFGGIQTNYLVTHTNLFAAACSASGTFNFISHYGSVAENGGSIQNFFETGQPRMGASLWDVPDQYIKNSPIFRADKVTTPFLMMHTTRDGICPFANAVEFFSALRRLGKKVWMLEYTDGNHGLRNKSAVDFSRRMSQFFDHYLKDARPPKWMTKGIPAKLKGVADGLALDDSIQAPGPGLLIEESKEEKDIRKKETDDKSARTKPDEAKP